MTQIQNLLLHRWGDIYFKYSPNQPFSCFLSILDGGMFTLCLIKLKVTVSAVKLLLIVYFHFYAKD